MSDSNYWTRTAGQRISRRGALRGGAVAGLGLAGVALIGCGGDDDDDDDTGAAATATPTQAAAATGTAAPVTEGVPGQEMVMPEVPTYTYQHLDPTTAVWTAAFTWPTHDMLMRRDTSSTNNADWKIEGNLAESWEVVDDLTFVFKIRQGIKFHDIAPVSGRELTSADVKFSLERIGTEDPKFFRQGEMKDATVTTPDANTVQIAFTRPQGAFWNRITTPGTVALPVETQEIEGDVIVSGNPLAGTGPFIHQDFVENETFKVTKNPDYWKPGLPYLDGMDGVTVESGEPQWVSFKAGDLDWVQLRSLDVTKEAKKIADITVDTRTGVSTHWVVLNTKVPPFDDQRVRYAVSLAHPRREIVDVALGGLEFAQMLGPGGLNPEIHGAATYAYGELKTRPGYRTGAEREEDLTEARKLMEAAGVPELDHTFGYTQHLAAWPWNDSLATIMIEGLAEIGIKSTLDPYQYGDTLVQLANKEFGLYHTPQFANGLDPNEFLEFYFNAEDQGGVRNYGEWSHPDFTALMEKQNATVDIEERNALILEVVKLLETEVPRAPTMVQKTAMAIQGWMHNWNNTYTSLFENRPETIWRDA